MKEAFFSKSEPVMKIRGIHLDLKGLPPSPSRLLELLELFHIARINCVLVEWEDTYPWRIYPELKNKTAYSVKTVKKFLEKAEKLNIEVIPLVQSFGHLENVLSKKKFSRFREIPDSVNDICPLKKGSGKIIENMIRDILSTHKNIRYFHLGGDEVWSLGSCEKCSKFVKKNGRASLYLYHLEPLFELLNSSGIRPVIWDDMMRKWDIVELEKIGRQTSFVCWSYGKDPFNFITRDVIEKFIKAGCKLWAGSAFKGADGAYADIPNLENRTANMLAWVEYAKKTRIEGVIATGWSRYNTFLSPCESIESSLDSLVLAGRIAWDGELPESITDWVKDFLNYCQRKGVKTDHFFSCREASEQLQNWRNSAFARIRNYLQQAHIAGEPERLNPARAKEAKRAVSESMDKLVHFAKEWAKAHKGLVPDLWIRKYVCSRIEPVRKILKVLP